jgi:hypothetical protein
MRLEALFIARCFGISPAIQEGIMRKNQSTGASSALTVTFLFSLSVVLSACGSPIEVEIHSERKPSQSNTSSSTSNSTTSSTCSASATILPDHDFHLDGSGRYRACESSTQTNLITVRGYTHSTQRLCLFPIHEVDSSHVYWKPDLTKGGIPLYQCQDMSRDVADFTFESALKFNAFFAVEEADVNTMQTCIGTGNYNGCPRWYSYGKFRN